MNFHTPRYLVAVLFLQMFLSQAGWLQAGTYQIPATDTPVAVDGKLGDEAWRSALRISLDYETDPSENIAPPVATEGLMTYDRDYLYIAFQAHDPNPGQIRARLADRDTIRGDDMVGVVLDTFNDERRAFQFFVNPLGVQMDRTQDDVNGNEDTSWDAIWRSAGQITDTGYVVEMALPFSSLRFPRQDGAQTWGLDLQRSYPRGDRHQFSNNPRDRNINCRLCQISKAVGFENVTVGRNIEINPTVTGSYIETREAFPNGDFIGEDFIGEDFIGEDNSEPGLTMRWGITPNMTLSGTLNPDFSQVEADSAQLEINNQFSLFFPERRPFFLEGADLFASPLRTVFTRNVADPTWGIKLTGKEGKNAVGVFVAQDELTNLVFPGSQGSSSGSFDFETTDTVLRYRRDLPKQSTIGAMVTSRAGEGYTNHVYGVDGMVRLSDTDTIRVQALQSRTEYPGAIVEEFDQPADTFADEAWTLRYSHRERNWDASFLYEDVGAGFRADMGFQPQVDYRLLEGRASKIWWGTEESWYNRAEVGGSLRRREDQSGQLLREEANVHVEASGPKQSFVWISVGQRTRRFDGVDFEEKVFRSWFRVQPSGQLEFSMSANYSDEIDFAHTRPGEQLSLEPQLRLDIGDHLRTRLSHNFRTLDVDGGRLFEAHLSQLRAIYQINLRSFVRAIFQYTNITRDPSLFEEPVESRTARLFNQLLFGYKLNPRTVFYLGYSDGFSGNENQALTQENRALFMKVGYAWVL